jgi:anti-sigma B factor antagonist
MALLEYESHDGWMKILLSGDVTCEFTTEIKIETEALLETFGSQPVVACDLSQVRFLDSSGIGLLVFLNNKLRQKSGRFYLYKPSEPVRKTLDLVQLLSFFELIESEQDLLAQLS